jgi:HPr kinase/phosphorylase
VARPPANLAGLIEIRGVGIVSLQWCREARIALAIDLAASETVARYPERNTYVPPEDIGLPEIAQPPLLGLAAFESSTPAKILAAAAARAHARFREACNPL